MVLLTAENPPADLGSFLKGYTKKKTVNSDSATAGPQAGEPSSQGTASGSAAAATVTIASTSEPIVTAITSTTAVAQGTPTTGPSASVDISSEDEQTPEATEQTPGTPTTPVANQGEVLRITQGPSKKRKRAPSASGSNPTTIIPAEPSRPKMLVLHRGSLPAPNEERMSGGTSSLPWSRYNILPKAIRPEASTIETPGGKVDYNDRAQFPRVAREIARMCTLPRDEAYVKKLSHQQRLDELYVSLANVMAIIPALEDRDAHQFSLLETAKQEASLYKTKVEYAETSVGTKVKEAAEAAEAKVRGELEVQLSSEKEKYAQLEAEKKTLLVDLEEYKKRVAELEEEVREVKEKADLAEAQFQSREEALKIQGRNEFVASDEAAELLQGFSLLALKMGFTTACDEFVNDPTRYEGHPYDPTATPEAIKEAQDRFKTQLPIPGAGGAGPSQQGATEAHQGASASADEEGQAEQAEAAS